MENEAWVHVKRFYKDNFGVPENIVEFMGVEELLKLCAMGWSNMRIARYIGDSDSMYVEEVLNQFLKDGGWENDTDLNPLEIYNTKSNYGEFASEIRMISPMMNNAFINKAYRVCKNFKEIERKIEENVK